MKIVIDAFGGDHAPDCVVNGTIMALNKFDDIEIVLTGRYAHPELKAMAHLVTEMKPIKHYFDMGVMARQGIEY